MVMLDEGDLAADSSISCIRFPEVRLMVFNSRRRIYFSLVMETMTFQVAAVNFMYSFRGINLLRLQ